MRSTDPLMDEELTITRRQLIDAVQKQMCIERSVLAGHQGRGAAQIMWRELGGTDHRPKVSAP
jgi:hypothetical protein